MFVGWLYEKGFQDFAGGGPVHLLGGTIGLAATVFLGPRMGIYSSTGRYAWADVMLWWIIRLLCVQKKRAIKES